MPHKNPKKCPTKTPRNAPHFLSATQTRRSLVCVADKKSGLFIGVFGGYFLVFLEAISSFSIYS